MRKYIKYDNAGNISCFGVMSAKKFQVQALTGEKILAVDKLKRKMDVDNTVKDGKIKKKSIAIE